MPEGPPPALELKNVEKQYGGLRPLRIRDLRIEAGRCAMLIGFDRPTAETFVNLITGAGLPEQGEVAALGRPTREIADSDQWLAFVERFGIVSDRSVLLDGMTLAQNLAISFDIDIEPVPPAVMARVMTLAAEADIAASALEARMGDVEPSLRARVYLARALAFDPAILVLEHPTATLSAPEGKDYAALVRRISAERSLTTVGLTVDEKFAKATGGRLLYWQPATGEMRERSGLRLW